MWYAKDITVAANTSRLNATRTTIKVWKGVIHRVWVLFPAGCAGLAHARVQHGLHSLVPSNPDAWLTGDNTAYNIRTWYELMKEHNIISIYTYNTDETYAHTLTIGLGILPKPILMPAFSTESIIAAMRSLFRRG